MQHKENVSVVEQITSVNPENFVKLSAIDATRRDTSAVCVANSIGATMLPISCKIIQKGEKAR